MCYNVLIFMDKRKIILQILILTAITLTCYCHILHNPFVVDDDQFICRWQETHNFKNLPLFLKGITPYDHEGVYRPVKTILIVLLYKVSGSNPLGYHVFSIVVHVLSVLLIYMIALSIVKRARDFIPFFTALFFAVHPVHVESITYMTSSFDIAGIAFTLTAFLFYIKFLDQNRNYFYILSSFFALLSFFTYEVSLTLVLLIPLYNICFRDKPLVKFCIPYFLIAAFYFSARFYCIGIGGKGGYILDNFYYTILMTPKVILTYIQLLILPSNLTMNHKIYDGVYSMLYIGYNIETLSSFSFSDLRVFIPLSISAICLILSLFYLKRKPIITFSVLWFFISLLPVLNIVPSGILMAEKFMYLASFGYCFLLSYVLYELTLKSKYRYLAVFIVWAIAAFYFKTTVLQNYKWSSPFWHNEEEAARFPNNPSALNNLAYTYIKINNYETALKYLTKSRSLDPNGIRTRENMVACLIHMGHYNEALQECQDLLKIHNRQFIVYTNMSAIYNRTGNYTDAASCAERAIHLQDFVPQSYNNLIEAYTKSGDTEKADKYYKLAIKKGLEVNNPKNYK